jgi:hypothetical protein
MSSNSENQVDFVERVCVNQRKLKSGLKSQYDVIVCGSGSSGSVVVPDSRQKPSWPASRPNLLQASGATERNRTGRPHQRQHRLDRLSQQRQHHRRLRHHEPEMVGIGLPAETGVHLEDRVHAQH